MDIDVDVDVDVGQIYFGKKCLSSQMQNFEIFNEYVKIILEITQFIFGIEGLNDGKVQSCFFSCNWNFNLKST